MKQHFADSHFFFALLSRHDEAHIAAVRFSRTGGFQLVTTEWILVEVADGLSAPHHRAAFGTLLDSLKSNPNAKIIRASDKHLEQGIQLYLARADKGWSLTDCMSFVVMEENSINEALTGDKHFEQAGFTRLLS